MNFNKELRLVYEPVDLRALIDGVMELLKMKTRMKKIKLLKEIDPQVPKYFRTEPRRLKQILLNLFSNAIKFTFKGHIKIVVTLSARCILHLTTRHVRIEVQDTGLGIKKEDTNKLFKMFGRLEGTKKQNKGGTGLGLMISNRLAKKLSPNDESIGVKSILDKGSTFSFVLEDKQLERHPSQMSIMMG